MQNCTKEDILNLLQEESVKILNLCHIPEDGRLKTLSFAVKDQDRIEEILELGERVDGSSLFSYIDPDRSDIYITPKTETVFVDPFSSTATLNILCQYLNEDGEPLEIAPENILQRAEAKLHSSTGVILKALAELEFYFIYRREEMVFPEVYESNYHESRPFTRLGDIRNEIMTRLEDIGVPTKYGHAEVGKFPSKGGYVMEQHEVELLPQNLTRMAEAITITKWVIRNVCANHGIFVSFSPKLSLEHAGNGMHLHLCGLKEGKNIIADSGGGLADEARHIVGGILKFAPSLTAFGNTVPASYLRFISRKESPMHICWGAKNRLALVRIPLWWDFKGFKEADGCRRTFEFRAPDSTANSYLLFAGIAVAAEYGLRNSKEAAEIAFDLNADSKVKESKKRKALPLSCAEAADNLRRDREYYEAGDVFPTRVIDGMIGRLKAHKDEGVWERLADEPNKVEELLLEYMHCG